MDDIDGFVIIQDEDNLQQPAAATMAPDEPLLIFTTERVWRLCTRNDCLCLLRLHSVPRNVFDVPVIPPKEHEPSILHI
jgi:hypothetical protein